MVEIPVEAFTVWCAMRAVPRDDHVSHLEGVTPLTWKYMPCERLVKLSAGGRDLLCLGITFIPMDVASLLLGRSLNIVEFSQTLSLLLTIQELL